MCYHWLHVCSAQSLAAHWARAVAGPGQGLVTTDWSGTQEMALASLVCTPVPCTHRGHTGTCLTLGGEMTSGSGHQTASWISPKTMMRRKTMLHWSWSLWEHEWREWGSSDMSLNHRPPGHLGPGPLPCRHMRTHNLPHTGSQLIPDTSTNHRAEATSNPSRSGEISHVLVFILRFWIMDIEEWGMGYHCFAWLYFVVINPHLLPVRPPLCGRRW